MWFIEGNEVEGAPELAADNWKGGVEFEGPTNEVVNRRRTTQLEACLNGLVKW